MTREEVLAITYLLPRIDGHPDRLRALLPYDAIALATSGASDPLPPQEAFEGPCSRNSLWSTRLHVQNMQWRLQNRPNRIEKPEVELQRYALHEEGLDKAIPLAEAGWEIYSYDIYLAVLVSPEA